MYIQEGSLGRVGGEGLFRSFEQAVRDHFHREALPDTSFCPEPVGGRPEPQSYVLNILPRRLPKVVVSGEHFVLKDLPFYERASEANAKARQECLDQREEKRQEGTLRKTPVRERA